MGVLPVTLWVCCTHKVTGRGISTLHDRNANKPMRPQIAAEEVTVTRSTARLAEARPPAIPLTMYTAGTARMGTKRTRSRYLPKVQRHVLMQNSWIKPARQSLLLGENPVGGPIAWIGGKVCVGEGGGEGTTHIMGPTPFVLVICFPHTFPQPLTQRLDRRDLQCKSLAHWQMHDMS